MVEAISNRKLYHVTVANNYKRALTMGQQITAGQAINPFFAFYEGVIEFPVTDGDTGATMQINAITWLKRVREGTIRTSHEILATLAFEISDHYIMLCRELLMEEIRRAEFNSNPPSRQCCLFLCESPEEARLWNPLVGGSGAICELTCTGMIHRADSRLLLRESEPLSVTKDRARAYWRGDSSNAPRLETLFAGKAIVSAIGL
jgi:hypothetical protein